jgi:hypothetical protein
MSIKAESYKTLYKYDGIIDPIVIEYALSRTTVIDSVYTFTVLTDVLFGDSEADVEQVYRLPGGKYRKLLIPVIFPDDRLAVLFALNVECRSISVYSTSGTPEDAPLVNTAFLRVQALGNKMLNLTDKPAWDRHDVRTQEAKSRAEVRILLSLFAKYEGRLQAGAREFRDLHQARRNIAQDIMGQEMFDYSSV